MFKILLSISLICVNFSIHALEIPDNKRVDYWVKQFSQNKRQFFQASILRSGLYRPTIKIIFEDEELPIDLSWLPFIESGFDCSRKSKAKAAGCWQFMSKTGKSFGLKKGAWKDQRYDFNKSTVAAGKYLKKLYNRFGNWDLALSAYNCGPTKVRSEIKRVGKNYWDLKLPKETMNYTPQFYAVLKITRNLKKYGFKNAQNELRIVRLKHGSHNLRYIANNILQVDYKVFMRLNPGYEIGFTSPGESAVIYLMRDWDINLLRGFGLLNKY